MVSDFENILGTLQPYAIGITFVAIYVAEHAMPQRKDVVDIKHDFLNVLTGIFNLAIAATGGYYLQKLLEYSRINHFGLLNFLPKITWIRITIGFIVIDVFMYWWHRANHELSFLWRFHRFHHKDEKLNSTSAVRFHFIELLLSYVAKFCLFPLLGLSVTTVVFYSIVLFPVIVFHHSNVSISKKADHFLNHLFVTPFMHRIHHSKIIRETNSNYGSVFPYWDNLFHSYIAKPEKDIEFGINNKK